MANLEKLVEELSTLTVLEAANLSKLLEEITGLGLKEAKDLVEAAPKSVKDGVPKADAEKLKAKLEAEGAKVELK